MNQPSIVSLDIGGTKINAGRFRNGMIESSHSLAFNANASEQQVLDFVISCISGQLVDDTIGIAIGVPCLVDLKTGVIFDAVNIRSWQEVALRDLLQAHFSLPVYINNDVNCFSVGESQFGKGKVVADMVGICLGTGFGAGIILNNKLYNGQNCGAGEVGAIAYKSATIDDYCSGQFFKTHYQKSGSELALLARQGDAKAIAIFDEFGKHLAQALEYVLLLLDPQMIIFGGSVSNSYDLFIDSLWRELKSFPYQNVIANLQIEKSELADAALLGAAQLFIEDHAEKDKLTGQFTPLSANSSNVAI